MAALAYIYPHWDRHPWYIIVYEFIEMIWPLVFFIWLIRYIILFTTLTILGTLVFTTHVNEWQDKVKGWLKQFNYSKAKAPKRLRVALPLSGRLLLERFLREHNLVTYLVVSCSGELWGKIILATICTQIPINVIFVRKMFVSVSGDDEALSSLRYILFLICFVQLLLFAIIFLPLGWCQKVSGIALIQRYCVVTLYCCTVGVPLAEKVHSSFSTAFHRKWRLVVDFKTEIQ